MGTQRAACDMASGNGEDQERIKVRLSEVEWESAPIGKIEFYQALNRMR